MKKYRYNKEADAYLTNLYKSVGAKTDEQKYNTLKLASGANCINWSHDISKKSQVAGLEISMLIWQGIYPGSTN